MATETEPTRSRALESAGEMPGFDFREGDAPALVQTAGGEVYRVPQRMLGRAAKEGLAALDAAGVAQYERKLKVAEENAGPLATVLTGVEAGASALTFGGTDALAMGVAQLAGQSAEEYQARRAERMEASPTAALVGEVLGIAIPALLTEGAALGVRAGTTAAKAAALTPVGLAMKAGRAATEAVGARLPIAATTGAKMVQTAAARTVGGALEGALWGAGSGVQERIVGKADDLSEAIASHVGTDALLFGGLGGTLGLLEVGLPAAVRGSSKVIDNAFDKAPAWLGGRQKLLEFWKESPGLTGVIPETAEALVAQRDQLVALDEKIGGVLDAVAARPKETAAFAVANAPRLEEIAASTPLGPRTVTELLGLPPERLPSALANSDSLLRLQEVSKGKALPLIRELGEAQQEFFINNAQRLAEAARSEPNALQVFASIVSGADSELAIRQSQKLLDNFERILTVDAARNELVTSLEGTHGQMLTHLQGAPATATRAAVPSLEAQAYKIAKLAETEQLAKIGEIGGPPSLEAVQTGLLDTTIKFQDTTRALLEDQLLYSPTVARSVQKLSDIATADFVGELTKTGEKMGLTTERAAELWVDPGKAMDRLKELRSELGTLRRELKLSTDLQEKNALKLVDELYKATSETLHNPLVFGEAAAIRNEVDTAFARMRNAYEPQSQYAKKFTQTMRVGGEKKVVARRTRYNEYVNQIGDPRTALDAGSLIPDAEALNEFANAYQNLVDTMRRVQGKVTQAAVPVIDAEVEALAQKAVAAAEEAETRFRYTRQWNQATLRLQQQGVGVGGVGGMTGGEWRPGSMNLGGFPHGVPTASVVTGSVVPEQVQQAAASVPVLGSIMRAAETLEGIPRRNAQVTNRVRALVATERRWSGFRDKIESGVARLMKAAASPTALLVAGEAARRQLTPERRRPPAGRRVLSEAEEVRSARAAERSDAETDQRIRRAHELLANPDELARLMEEQSHAVVEDMPETTSEVSLLAMRAAKVLAAAAPMPDGLALDTHTWSPAERARFRRIEAVVNEPTAVVDRAMEGTLTREEVSAVEEVYPNAMRDIRTQIMGKLDEDRRRGKIPTQQARQALETILGVPLTTNSTPAAVRRIQGVFGGARRGETARPTDTVRPMPGAARVTLGDRFQTDQQAANNRGR